MFIHSKIFVWGSRRQLAPFFGRSVKTVNHESRLKIWSKCLKWRLVPKWDEFNIDFSIDVSMVSGPNLVLTPLKRASKIQISSVVPGPPSKFFFGEHVLQPASIWMHAAYRCAHGAFFVFLEYSLWAMVPMIPMIPMQRTSFPKCMHVRVTVRVMRA